MERQIADVWQLRYRSHSHHQGVSQVSQSEEINLFFKLYYSQTLILSSWRFHAVVLPLHLLDLHLWHGK